MNAPAIPFLSGGAGGGFGITGSPSAGWTFTKAAQAGTAEVVATFSTTDSPNAVMIENTSTVDGNFTPGIRGVHGGTSIGLTLIGQAATDSGTNPPLKLRGRIGTGTNVASRPLLTLENNTTEVASVSAKGAWTYTVLHTDSAAETLASWGLDEDTSAKITFENLAATNTQFHPMLHGQATSTRTGLRIRATGTTDTGPTAVMVLESRVVAGTIGNRPAISFQNNTIEMAQFTAAGHLTLANQLNLKSFTVATLPSAATVGGMVYVSDAAGSPCAALSDGTNWKRCDDTSVTVS